MAYTITITYTAANDILNAKKEAQGVVTPTPVTLCANRPAPSDAYIYAPEGSTKPVYNAENFATIAAAASSGVEKGEVSAVPGTTALLTGSQKRWPKSTANGLFGILEAYATPQVPAYRAWQTFKLAITSGTYEFATENFAESEFYREAGRALSNYGITVAVASA